MREFISKRIHRKLTTSELRVLSQDRVLYKRLMHINEIVQTALNLGTALITLVLVQCINVIP